MVRAQQITAALTLALALAGGTRVDATERVRFVEPAGSGAPLARQSSGEVLARCEPLFDHYAGLAPQTPPEQLDAVGCADLFAGFVTAYCVSNGQSAASVRVERAASYWRGFIRLDPYAGTLPFVSTMTGALISNRLCWPARPERELPQL